MSDNEHFLSRWSRRKQEAKQPDHADEQAPAAAAAGGEVAGTVPPAVTREPVEKFDPESLPSIDMIEATSDVRAFLTKGVPADLTKAALRRAWSSDPAIRDFVGLSENAWDFNAPETIPGFSGALPLDEVQRILAQMMPPETAGESPQASEAVSGEPIPVAECETHPAQTSGNTPQPEKHTLVNADDEGRHGVAVSDLSQHATIENKNEDVAVQNPNIELDTSKTASKPRHGGALPK